MVGNDICRLIVAMRFLLASSMGCYWTYLTFEPSMIRSIYIDRVTLLLLLLF